MERAEELEKIKRQQRETGEGLAALRQRFEDQGVAAAESAAEVKGLLQQLLARGGTQPVRLAASRDRSIEQESMMSEEKS